MSDAAEGNPIGEGLGHAARQAAEVAAVLAMGAQAALRVRERQLQARPEVERGQLRAEHAAARLTWQHEAPVSAAEAARAWSAAQPWAGRDQDAADAARLAEARLDELVPDLMARYRPLVAEGTEPALAMSTAAASLGGAAAAACAEATAQRSAAAAGYATPDVPSTGLDEHHQGVTIGVVHAEEADAAAARAAALAAVAYPQPVTAALASLPHQRVAGRPAVAANREMHRGRGR
jgi:hypothetical protein